MFTVWFCVLNSTSKQGTFLGVKPDFSPLDMPLPSPGSSKVRSTLTHLLFYTLSESKRKNKKTKHPQNIMCCSPCTSEDSPDFPMDEPMA